MNYESLYKELRGAILDHKEKLDGGFWRVVVTDAVITLFEEQVAAEARAEETTKKKEESQFISGLHL